MIYLGDKPVGLLSILPEWVVYGNNKLEFNQNQSFDTATLFFNDSYVKSKITILPAGSYKIIFEDNTENTRAGQWITFVKNSSNEISNVRVMRVGMAKPNGNAYGIDVYENAKGIILYNTKEVIPLA